MQAVRRFALLPVLALAVAACAGTESGAETPQPAIEPTAMLQRASEALANETLELTFTMEADAEGQHVEASGEAAVDPGKEIAHLTLAIEGMPGMPGMNEMPVEMEMVVDGTAVYVRGDVLPDAGWLKMDAAHAGMGPSFGGGAMEPTDPTALIEALEAATDIEFAGSEEIRGTPTTHLTGTLDLEALLRAMPMAAGEGLTGKDRAALEDAIGQMEAELGEVRTTFDAWIDADGVPRRFALGVTTERKDGTFAMTFDVIEVGGALDIEVPSGKDVTDLGSLDAPLAGSALS